MSAWESNSAYGRYNEVTVPEERGGSTGEKRGGKCKGTHQH